MPATEKAVLTALKTVKDPELNLDLVVLGLVYDVEVEDAKAKATISLTTPMCPAAGQIVEDAKAAIGLGRGGGGGPMWSSPSILPGRRSASVR